ncbi:MAG: hypothetical protein KF832_31675 [Caldilineaceae bacterium]|nr:hypothetical protein [Caldilineaceae bacterium]
MQIEVWEQILVLLQEALPLEAVTTEQDAAWDSFLSLANDAQPGFLENPSVQHDTYLYG